MQVDRHEMIELARAIACENGYADRIVFIHTPLDRLVLPSPVDVIVAHHGLPDLLALLPDAQARFLKPGGTMIPARVEVVAAPVETPRLYRERVECWGDRQDGLSFAPVRGVAANVAHGCRLLREEAIGGEVRLACFEFSRLQERRLAATAESTIIRDGTLHGLAISYVKHLTDDVALSTAPGSTSPYLLWQNAFLPVANPVPVSSGHMVRMQIRTGGGGSSSYWAWNVLVRDSAGHESAKFTYSTFAHALLPRNALRHQAPAFRPGPSPRGAAAKFVLERCDGRHARRDIEWDLLAQFPAVFESDRAVARFVTDIIRRYGGSDEPFTP